MKTTIPYKIILADDHILLRDALAKLITGFEEFTVIATAANGKEVIELIESGIEPDILIMDLNMPVIDGYEATKWLAKKHPHIKIVILTMYDSEVALVRLLQWGISGFLKKDIHPFELNNALLNVATGENYYGNQTSAKIVSIFREKTDNHAAFEKMVLDDQEIEFLKLSITEMSYREIAEAMHVPLTYLDGFRKRFFKKIKVESRVESAIYAVKNGIVAF